MKHMFRCPGTVRRALLPMMAVTLALGVWSCGAGVDELSPTAPQAPVIAQQSDNLASSATVEAIGEALQGEYYALFTYARVVADFGEVRPFANVVGAEQRHADSIAALLVMRGLDVPASAWDESNVPTFDTLIEACAGGKDVELATIAMYRELLLLELPADVGKVFERHLAVSLEQHLPAFERCLGRAS